MMLMPDAHGPAWPLPTRRDVMQLIGTAASLSVAPASAWAQDSLPPDLSFRIYRNGDDVGRYQVQFDAREDGFAVAASVDIAIKVAFMTAYRYRQSADDRWRHGELTRAVIRTNDNGVKTRVQIGAEGDKLKIEGPRGLLDVPLGMMTDGSLWNIAVTRQSQVIDGERGDLMKVGGAGPFEETLELDGGRIAAKRFMFAADAEHDLAGHLWYDTTDRLVRISLETRGERFEYYPVG